MLYNLAVKESGKSPATYITFENGEVIENPDIIDFYRLHQYDEILSYKLLGEFSKEGQYQFTEEIKKMLVGVKKLLTGSDESVLIAQSDLKNIDLHFKLTYWSEGSEGYASLFLIEMIDQEQIVTFVAQYHATFNAAFLDKAKKVFNFVKFATEAQDEYAQQIEDYVQALEQKLKERDFVVELQSEMYINDMMDALEHGGEMSRRVLEKFRPTYEKLSLSSDKSRIFTKLRRELDMLIMAEGGFKPLAMEIKTLPLIFKNFSRPVLDYDKVSRQLEVLNAPSKKEKAASSTKKSSPSKPNIPKPRALTNPYKTKSSGGKKKNSEPKKIYGKAPVKQEAEPEPTKPSQPPQEKKESQTGEVESQSVPLKPNSTIKLDPNSAADNFKAQAAISGNIKMEENQNAEKLETGSVPDINSNNLIPITKTEQIVL